MVREAFLECKFSASLLTMHLSKKKKCFLQNRVKQEREIHSSQKVENPIYKGSIMSLVFLPKGSENLHPHKYLHTDAQMFTAALFIMAKIWK